MAKKFLCLFALFLSACVPTQINLAPEDSYVLSLGKFQNRTYESGISDLIRCALVDIAPQWGFRFSKGEETLEGVVEEIDYQPLIYSEKAEIEGTKVYLRVKILLKKNNQLLLEKNLSVSTVFFSDEGKETGLKRVSERMATEIFKELLKWYH